MKEMTKENLKAAFAGESQAHMKYMIFSDKAEQEGFKNVAKLFKAISYAERVHATNHLKTLGEVKSTADNLTAAAGGENFEVEEMYPAYDVVAKLQNEPASIKSIHYAIEAEKIHEVMYNDAKKFVLDKLDIADADIYVCPVCGHTVIGEPPDKCPVCNLSKDKYRKF